ncbi:uncharacterized protein LOC133370721 [Rhineura floridana]|uniref:uncharacterized protein LOC133370721 n=1 Tax=Rhineura floridana TaxID=261503 RepID=UPI002AC85EBD|nr:uncharacterized protein LOC133370721 [Rhineura floridana]
MKSEAAGRHGYQDTAAVVGFLSSVLTDTRGRRGLISLPSSKMQYKAKFKHSLYALKATNGWQVGKVFSESGKQPVEKLNCKFQTGQRQHDPFLPQVTNERHPWSSNMIYYIKPARGACAHWPEMETALKSTPHQLAEINTHGGGETDSPTAKYLRNWLHELMKRQMHNIPPAEGGRAEGKFSTEKRKPGRGGPVLSCYGDPARQSRKCNCQGWRGYTVTVGGKSVNACSPTGPSGPCVRPAGRNSGWSQGLLLCPYLLSPLQRPLGEQERLAKDLLGWEHFCQPQGGMGLVGQKLEGKAASFLRGWQGQHGAMASVTSNGGRDGWLQLWQQWRTGTLLQSCMGRGHLVGVGHPHCRHTCTSLSHAGVSFCRNSFAGLQEGEAKEREGAPTSQQNLRRTK